MTYDYGRTSSTARASHFNAPMPWIRSVMQSFLLVSAGMHAKLLLGINMYGWRNHDEAMTGSAMLQWMSTAVAMHAGMQVRWDVNAQEHVFIDKTAENVYDDVSSFPTNMFVYVRVEYARELKLAGVALWELGQMKATFVNVL